MDIALIASRIIPAFALNVLLAAGALRAKAVTPGGAVTGFIMGLVIYLASGAAGWLALGYFFISSSILGRILSDHAPGVEKIHEKSGARDGWQAAANAGPGVVSLVLYIFFGNSIFLAGYLGSMACATADTWASELGILSRKQPILLRNLRPVTPGTSGAVSAAGTLGSVAGAVTTAAFALLPPFSVSGPFLMLAVAAVGGVVGALADSVLGAFLQEQFADEAGNYSERAATDGEENRFIRGIRGIDNDAVNFLSNVIGTVLSIALAYSLISV